MEEMHHAINAAENEGMVDRRNRRLEFAFRACYTAVERYLSGSQDMSALRTYFHVKTDRELYVGIGKKVSPSLLNPYHESGIMLQISNIVGNARYHIERETEDRRLHEIDIARFEGGE